MARIDRDELRQMVRQALKETLGAGGASGDSQPAGLVAELRAALGRGRTATIAVAVRSAADLDRLARGLLDAGDHADLKAAILAGDIRFEPAGEEVGQKKTVARSATKEDAGHFESGVLGETKIVELARSHRSILIGRKVVVTPLAREKARQLKIELVRQKP